MRATTLLLTGLLVYYGGTLLETGEGTLVYETIWSRSLEAYCFRVANRASIFSSE